VIPRSEYEGVVRAALREDAPFGDPFGEAFPAGGSGVFWARADGVFCGGAVAREVFLQVDPSVVAEFVPDGKTVAVGDRLGEASGPVAALLRSERVALNFLQRLSGVATATSRYVRVLEAYGTRLLDTRKTTPLLRSLEKYAVRVGGGANHRFSLSDGILIKENGIRAAGGIAAAVAVARASAHHLLKIEVEAENLSEADEAVRSGADAVLLDNMAPETVREAVSRYGGRVFLEASGGIDLHNVEGYARTGVAAVAVGAITHSAVALDISFELSP
jgi:nicotinate-nucleotide pyrophosphorylase (carboxylating)